jgi:hypothetical protein
MDMEYLRRNEQNKLKEIQKEEDTLRKLREQKKVI